MLMREMKMWCKKFSYFTRVIKALVFKKNGFSCFDRKWLKDFNFTFFGINFNKISSRYVGSSNTFHNEFFWVCLPSCEKLPVTKLSPIIFHPGRSVHVPLLEQRLYRWVHFNVTVSGWMALFHNNRCEQQAIADERVAQMHKCWHQGRLTSWARIATE